MTVCTLCSVNSIDRHCTNTPRTCFECCTTNASINTCPPHFHSLGNSAAAARLLTGMVHPNILADAADEGEVKEDESTSSSSSSSPAGGLPLPGDAAAAAAAGVAEQPTEPTLASLAALIQQLLAAQAADRAALAVVAAAALPPPRVRPAAAAAAPTTAAPSTAAILPFVPLATPVSDGIPALVNPPPAHRAAVLDRAAVASQADITALVDRFSALPVEGDSDDEGTTVSPQPHIRTARPPPPTAAAGFLPSTFVPPPIGTAQSATQQLADLFTLMHKQGGKAKYSSIEELNEALEDWVIEALQSGRTAHQVESIRAYQRLLVTQFATSDRMPLKQVFEYHRQWCKAVHAGTIDLFARGAAMNHDIYYAVTHPLRLTSQGSVNTFPQQKGGKTKAASDKTTVTAPKKTYAAGSCTHHPTSTTHTTAECLKKGQ